MISLWGFSSSYVSNSYNTHYFQFESKFWNVTNQHQEKMQRILFYTLNTYCYVFVIITYRNVTVNNCLPLYVKYFPQRRTVFPARWLLVLSIKSTMAAKTKISQYKFRNNFWQHYLVLSITPRQASAKLVVHLPSVIVQFFLLLRRTSCLVART